MRHRLPLGLAVLALASTAALAFAQNRGGLGEQPSGISPVDRLFASDANGDGKLSRDELPGRFERIFGQADADKDGFLDKAELTDFFDNRRGRGVTNRDQDRDGRGDGRGDREEATVSFGRHMSTLGRTMRRLSRSELDASSLDADLTGVEAVQTALIGAKSQLQTVKPAKAGLEKSGGDVAAYHKAFRRQLLAALAKSIDLERALLDGHANEARGYVKELVGIRDAGHATFQPEDDDDQPRPAGGR